MTTACAPAGRDQFYAGLQAYDQGHYAEAAEEWRAAADAGDLAAARNLGHLYRRGQGVAQDGAAAAESYKIAAEGGLALAQYNLGTLYIQGGPNLPKDRNAAVYWLTLAAQAGVPQAAEALAALALAPAPPPPEAPTAAESAEAAPEPAPATADTSAAESSAAESSAAELGRWSGETARAQLGSYRYAKTAEQEWVARFSQPGLEHRVLASKGQDDLVWYRLLVVGPAEAIAAYCEDAVARRRECRILPN